MWPKCFPPTSGRHFGALEISCWKLSHNDPRHDRLSVRPRLYPASSIFRPLSFLSNRRTLLSNISAASPSSFATSISHLGIRTCAPPRLGRQSGNQLSYGGRVMAVETLAQHERPHS